MDIKETHLPGIGVRYDLGTRAGQRIAVVVRRDGRFELGSYDDARDPDVCRSLLQLSGDEAEALAGLLGAPRIVEALQQLDALDGLLTEQISIRPESRFAGATLGDTKARSLTGVSIVAVVRAGEAIPSPTPSTPLRAADVLVAVGTRDGLERLREIIDGE